MNVRIKFKVSSYVRVYKGVFKRVCMLFSLILRTGIPVHKLLFPERNIKFPKPSFFKEFVRLYVFGPCVVI